MLFILVACGAVSGFHSLVSSGTTSKQMDRESHGRPVVFGAMITEGALAMLALLAVSAGLAWSGSGQGGAGAFSAFMAEGKARTRTVRSRPGSAHLRSRSLGNPSVCWWE